MIGISIVNLALIAYSVAFFNQVKRKTINRFFLIALTTGVLLDLISTICMIIGSSKGIITLHGIIGYSSLSGMILETIFCYRYTKQNGIGTSTSSKLYTWTKVLYIYWVLVYISGAILIMLRHTHH